MLKVYVIPLIFLCTQCIGGTDSEHLHDKSVPTYTLNLDLPPRQRWTSIIEKFDREMILNGLKEVLEHVTKNDILKKLFLKICEEWDQYFPQPYADELLGMSDALNCDVSLPVMINVFYDIVAHKGGGSHNKACTSIVTMDKNGSIIHGRNFDFDFADVLRNMTFNMIFQKNGKTVYYGTTFVLELGPATLVKPEAFSLTMNERNTGWWGLNVISGLERALPVSMYLREFMKKSGDSYDDAIHMLRKERTISPNYIIVGGTKPYQGAVLIGNRWGMRVEYMNDTLQHGWFVVETNYDPWNDPPKNDDRRDAAISAMKSVGRSEMGAIKLFQVLSKSPVLNVNTVFTTIMSASDDSIFHCVVRQP